MGLTIGQLFGGEIANATHQLPAARSVKTAPIPAVSHGYWLL